jgi:hypothetical protein
VTAYLDDEDIRLASRSAMALALLPAEYVEEAFDLLEEDSPEDMAEFLEYFRKQWLKRVPKKYWNVSVLEFRTNNFTEGNLHSFYKICTFLLSHRLAQQVQSSCRQASSERLAPVSMFTTRRTIISTSIGKIKMWFSEETR